MTIVVGPITAYTSTEFDESVTDMDCFDVYCGVGGEVTKDERGTDNFDERVTLGLIEYVPVAYNVL